MQDLDVTGYVFWKMGLEMHTYKIFTESEYRRISMSANLETQTGATPQGQPGRTIPSRPQGNWSQSKMHSTILDPIVPWQQHVMPPINEQLQSKRICTVAIICKFSFTCFFTIILVLKKQLPYIQHLAKLECETWCSLFCLKNVKSCADFFPTKCARAHMQVSVQYRQNYGQVT